MEENKLWWQSKTIVGIAVSILALIANKVLGWTLTDADNASLADIVTMALAFGGQVFAWYGRVKANKAIGK